MAKKVTKKKAPKPSKLRPPWKPGDWSFQPFYADKAACFKLRRHDGAGGDFWIADGLLEGQRIAEDLVRALDPDHGDVWNWDGAEWTLLRMKRATQKT